jgi:hypothetical protein
LHDGGDEERWWKQRKVDPVLKACQLWRHTRDRGHEPVSEQSKSVVWDEDEVVA